MRRHASRHATDTEEADAIEGLTPTGAELVVRGVASNPAALVPSQVNPYLPAPSPQTIATRPSYDATWNPYPGLALHVADQLTPGLAERTGWGLFQWLQDRHLLPGIGVLAGDVCGWGAAATEPMHPWFGSVFLGAGIAGAAVYGAIHVIRAVNGDDGEGPVSVGVHIIGLAGVALTAFGTACITGLSFLSAGVTLLPTAAAYYAWFQNRHSRLQDQRQFLVDHTAAATPALVPMPGSTAAAAPQVVAGQALSHEEQLVRRAFEGMRIELSDIHSFARVDADSWSVTVVLAPAPGVSPESIVARRDVLTNALGANQVIALPTRRGHELRLTVRYGEIDPLAEVVPFPGPVATSIAEPIPIAVAADGSRGELVLLGTHTLIGGATNGGKSVLLKTLVISLAALKDAVIWLVDLKPGRIELGIFEPIADRSARNIGDAALMLEALIAVAKARGDYLARLREESGRPVEKWDPAEHGPVIVIVFDEYAELLRQSKKVRRGEYPERVMQAIKFISENFETVAMVYRALGIQIVMATQSPSGAITAGNGKDGLDQIQNIVCVQTAKLSQTNIILGPGAHGDGYRAHADLYVSGMCYFRTPQVKIPIKYKGYWSDNDEIVGYIEQFAPQRPALADKAGSAEAAARVLGSAASTPRTTPPAGGGAPLGDVQDEVPPGGRLRLVTFYPDGTKVDARHEPMWDLLGSLGRAGATVSELAAAAQAAGHESCSPAWTRDLCKQWRTAGVVCFGVEGRDTRYWRDDDAVKRRLGRGA